MKPSIIVLSKDTDETFEWLSDGWYQVCQRGTEKAENLFTSAQRCIAQGQNVPEVIRLLREAGFNVRRK